MAAVVTGAATTRNDQQLAKAQDDFAFKVAGMAIAPDSIILVLQYAMEVVDLTTLTGAEKKEAVMLLVRKAVVDAPMEPQIESILLEMIDDGILSHTIDVIVSASRGKLHINGAISASRIACESLAPHAASCIARCIPSAAPRPTP
jgi:activator of HSP90 ATPase